MLKTQLHSTLNTIQAEWSELCNTSPYATPFQTVEWATNWLKHYPRKTKIISIHEGNDLVAVYPLVECAAPWRTLRPLGVGPSDYLGPILRSDDVEVSNELLDCLAALGKNRLVDIHQLPNDHPFSNCFAEPIEQARCLLVDLPPTFDGYLSGLSKSLRYDVRRLRGKALTEKGATLVWANQDNISRLSDQFFELHKLRWRSRGLPGAFFGKAESFQKEWMQLALKADTLRLCILESEGKAVGSIYGMKHGSTTYFYQAGMDPSASSLSPGTILTAALIERAIEEGCTTFDLMRGDEPYKRRWKPGRERVNLRTFLGKTSVLGRAGEAWNRQAWRVELKLRDRFEGKGLKQSKN